MALQSTTALATITLQAPTLEVKFNGIPSNYRDLILVCSVAKEAYNTGNGKGATAIQFNLDTGSNYSHVQMSADQNGPLSTSGTSTYIDMLISSYEDDVYKTLYISTIFDYAQTDKHKTVVHRANLATGNQYPRVSLNAYRWASLDAIHTIRMFSNIGGNFNAGDTISLYGRIA